jgi:acyl carrier protein
VEQALASLWQEVLGIAEIGIHDNFFDLGGHSLLATQVIAHVPKTLHVEVPLRVIFEKPTIAGMATFIETQHPAAPAEFELNQIMADLDQMTDEEVEQFLIEEQTENNRTQR